jgi:ribosome-binding factor A
MRGGVRDPGLDGVMVTRVEMTDDLQHARVYVRMLSIETPKEKQEALVRSLAHALPLISNEVGAKLGLRRVPSFRFHWDDSLEKMARIESLLEEIEKEKLSPT